MTKGCASTGDHVGQCANISASTRLARQQRRLRVLLLQILKDGERLDKRRPVLVDQCRKQHRGIEGAVAVGQLLTLDEIDEHHFGLEALHTQSDPHPERRLGAPEGIKDKRHHDFPLCRLPPGKARVERSSDRTLLSQCVQSSRIISRRPECWKGVNSAKPRSVRSGVCAKAPDPAPCGRGNRVSWGTAGVPEGVLLEFNGISRDLTPSGLKTPAAPALKGRRSREICQDLTDSRRDHNPRAWPTPASRRRCAAASASTWSRRSRKRMVRVPGADLPQGGEGLVTCRRTAASLSRLKSRRFPYAMPIPLQESSASG